MRGMMIVTILVVGFALTAAISPELRDGIARLLKQPARPAVVVPRRTTTPTQADPPAVAVPAATPAAVAAIPTPQAVPDATGEPVQEAAPELVRPPGPAPQPGHSATVPAVAPPATRVTVRPAAPQPPAAAPPSSPPAPVVLPRGLEAVRFGMSQAALSAAMRVDWQKQEKGEVMLVHYPAEDHMQQARFHFAGDALYRIEIRWKPAEGEDLLSLYERIRSSYARSYGHLQKAEDTLWSDGTVTVRVLKLRDSAEASFTCPSARR